MTTQLEFIQVDTHPQQAAQYGVIWLHGLGADGHDFEGLVPELKITVPTRFIFPHAPQRAVTINGGMRMRAWYDILEMSLDRRVDHDNIRESREQVMALVDGLVESGISADKIIIAGFSQGGVIAYDVALNSAQAFAAVLALSTYLASPDTVPAASSIANQATPFCIHHGNFDGVVSPVLAEKAHQVLTAQGYDVSIATYPMAHGLCPAQVKDLAAWFADILK